MQLNMDYGLDNSIVSVFYFLILRTALQLCKKMSLGNIQ